MKPMRLADPFTEIVFARRQKMYGAYTLRRDYPQHLKRAALLMFTLTILLALLLRFVCSTAENVHLPENLVYKTTNVTEQRITQPHPIKHTSSPPSRKNLPLLITKIDSTETQITDTTTTHAQSSSSGSDSSHIGSSDSTSVGTSVVHKDSAPTMVYKYASKMPRFPGGDAALFDYLGHHIDCTGRWTHEGESGDIVFSLVVNRNGQVTDVTVVKDDVGFDCAEQAIGVIKHMPTWEPGMQGNTPVSVMFILPVRYSKSY